MQFTASIQVIIFKLDLPPIELVAVVKKGVVVCDIVIVSVIVVSRRGVLLLGWISSPL